MITIEQAAQTIVEQRTGKILDNGEQETFIDPLSIMLICSVLSTIFTGLRLWCQWQQDKTDGQLIQEACVNPSRRVRYKIEQSVYETVGGERYRKDGKQMVDAILQAGANASPADLESLGRQCGYTNRWGETEQEL